MEADAGGEHDGEAYVLCWDVAVDNRLSSILRAKTLKVWGAVVITTLAQPRQTLMLK
jgi:hypothetical protein